jgi:hypothetical protein
MASGWPTVLVVGTTLRVFAVRRRRYAKNLNGRGRDDRELLTHVFVPVYAAALLWAGLYLRDARLRFILSRR